ncbi:MAG: glycoside hydrolase family 9 protein [Bacteroidales bacterium]|nr:glycoside hydrolase family 9 protein [Bacteroidales bacterium]
MYMTYSLAFSRFLPRLLPRLLPLFVALALALPLSAQTSWVRINQLGYLPHDIKVAVLISTDEIAPDFSLCDARTGKAVFSGQGKTSDAAYWGMKSAYRLDFTSINVEGAYYIEAAGVRSPQFVIDARAYDGSADYLLNYMRQQRCGYNPYLDTLCHQHDGYIVDHPTRTGEQIDVRGGWHDATDYLQYLATSANATYQMMFAYHQAKDKSVFRDHHDANGRPGRNGIPDILDEIRWGLEWMLKMNPAPNEMYNQIADDRDHAGMRLPTRDEVDYGWGPGTGRPVYFITGERQGLPHPRTGNIFYNRTTGVASSAGKFASGFALGAELFKDIDPAFAQKMQEKAGPAYDFAVKRPGNTQTACVISPYFYEEDNYVDDIELAAATFYMLSKEAQWRTEADYWGQLEPITPWMELGRARHYQFYPFVNLGHYLLAKSEDEFISKKYTDFMRRGLQAIRDRAGNEPFMNGVPYAWCSNNLITAAITQARLYEEVSGDRSFAEMEAALRDWLFGCNPWGTSMIVGYPEGGVFPTQPHCSYLRVNGKLPYGGLIDGPLEKAWHRSQLGISLPRVDPLAPFQNGPAVYNDNINDYATNEPTMDGTASLSYYLSAMEQRGREQLKTLTDGWNVPTDIVDRYGSVVRRDPSKKEIYLIFSADVAFEGGTKVLDVLEKHNTLGSFFLTGTCLRMPQHKAVIERIIREGHYVGPHSDKHLLYAPWEDRQKTLVGGDSLRNDILLNVKELEKFGVSADQQLWFLPPYEYYNDETVRVSATLGLKVMNFTPGSLTNADYTTPSMSNYRSSQTLIDHVMNMESRGALHGAILLIHPGVSDERPDKLYDRLDELMTNLKEKGYSFKRF